MEISNEAKEGFIKKTDVLVLLDPTYLGVYEHSNRMFHHYDSLAGFNFEFFRPFCEQVLVKLGVSKNNLKSEVTPQQKNGNDCGVYVIAIIKFMVEKYRNSPSNFSLQLNKQEAKSIHDSIPEIRKELGRRLI
ncbi:11501_t:CDS:2 [Racocetra persica]|uniref:11501_t:CDS:1 n=1 Tax=Racocetra persica TaxID=160502 RepID=A0ACA9N9T6_9GLOM|nr:11501_t:CDS:2 [Racocetra persica]